MDNNRLIRLFFWATAALIFVYLAIRAWLVPPVHDEAATFFLYIQTGNFIPGYAFWDANNHLLNSALGHYFYELFGDHIFVLRLPSLLFFPLYALFAFRISGLFFQRYEKLLVALGFLLLHNFIEYFGYARGYGMAMACCLGLVYYLCAYLRSGERRQVRMFSIFVFLSLAASLNLLIVVLIATGYLFMVMVINKRPGIVWFVLWNGCMVLLTAWLGWELNKRGALYYGDENGFIPDTVNSLSTLLLGKPVPGSDIFLVIVGGITLLLVPFIIAQKKLRTFFTEPVWALQLMFWGNILAIFLMRVLLGTKYPEDRTVIHLFLLMQLLLFVTLQASGFNQKIRQVLSGTAAVLLAVLFIGSVNFLYSTFWLTDRVPYEFYERSQKGIKGHETYVTGHKLNALTWAFYNYRSGKCANPLHALDYPQQQGDYMTLYDTMYKGELKELYDIAVYDECTHKVLLERKKKHELQPIDTLTFPDFIDRNDMYFGLVDYRDTAIANENLCFDISAKMKTQERPILEFLVKTSAPGDPDHYESMNVNLNWRSKAKPQEGYEIRQRMYLPNVTGQPRDVAMFIYNQNQEVFSFWNLKVIVYRIKS